METLLGKMLGTCCGAASILICLCNLTTVRAQAVFCSSSVGVSCGAIRAAAEQPATGEPYLAQAVTELQQTMADGTHITQSSTATIARDSQGRTMRSETVEGIPQWISSSGSSGQSGKTTLTTIVDPVANEHIDYTSDSSVAHVIMMSTAGDPASLSGQMSGQMSASRGDTDASPMLIGGPPAPDAPAVAFIGLNPLHPDSARQSNANTVSLGTKTIDGIEARGTRATITIPVGTLGNDRNIVVTEETWYSPELKMVMESVRSDPRSGVTTYSVTNLDREEPDAILFQVPAGYTVQHVNGQVMIGSDNGSGGE
jgi:hypothetical protein